jgi:hypothetical protein
MPRPSGLRGARLGRVGRSRRRKRALAVLSPGVGAGSGAERGEPFTRYWATLDVEDFIARLPVGEREELREFFVDVWPTTLRNGVALDLALDSKGRIRRLDLTFVEGEKFVVELFDYGLDVHAAPPADQVMTSADYQKLVEQQMRVATSAVHLAGRELDAALVAARPKRGRRARPRPRIR